MFVVPDIHIPVGDDLIRNENKDLCSVLITIIFILNNAVCTFGLSFTSLIALRKLRILANKYLISLEQSELSTKAMSEMSYRIHFFF